MSTSTSPSRTGSTSNEKRPNDENPYKFLNNPTHQSIADRMHTESLSNDDRMRGMRPNKYTNGGRKKQSSHRKRISTHRRRRVLGGTRRRRRN